jgi:hypothetical protein
MGSPLEWRMGQALAANHRRGRAPQADRFAVHRSFKNDGLSPDPYRPREVCTMASWFVPPIVVPFMLAALIVGCGLYRIYL